MIEASSLVLATAHGQNQSLGMRDSQADGEHYRTVHHSMDNGTGDQFPVGKPDISSSKCAFYTYIQIVVYIFPLRKTKISRHFLRHLLK